MLLAKLGQTSLRKRAAEQEAEEEEEEEVSHVTGTFFVICIDTTVTVSDSG